MSKPYSKQLIVFPLLIAIISAVLLFLQSAPPAAEAEEANIPVYRLSNPYDGQHLLTIDSGECAALQRGGWVAEGRQFNSASSGGTPIYRLYNPSNGDHLYTANNNEYLTLQRNGWLGEGAKIHGTDKNGIPVYRLWNSQQTANGGLGSHLWTVDRNEYDTLPSVTAGTWKQEGLVWYGLPLGARKNLSQERSALQNDLAQSEAAFNNDPRSWGNTQQMIAAGSDYISRNENILDRALNILYRELDSVSSANLHAEQNQWYVDRMAYIDAESYEYRYGSLYAIA